MKLSIIGTRGIPAKYGGFETFAEEISVLLASRGIDVTVQCDYNSNDTIRFKGVNLYFTSVTKSERTLKYYYEGLKWGLNNSDVVLAASTAASFFYFLNFFKRKIIITNPDGLEHKRAKWSFLKKMYLKISEYLAVRMSDYLVADSESIRNYICNKYHRASQKTRVIEYGAYENNEPDDDILDNYGIRHHGYYLVVCRLEPENNIEMILEGYRKALTVKPLIIIGNIIGTEYVKRLVNLYNSDKIRFLGGIYDKKVLNALRFSCNAYIHGHSVGGTNPSLLEALASRNLIIAHDNIFNREVTSDRQFYFTTPEQLAGKIYEIELMPDNESTKLRDDSYRLIADRYNWNIILEKYLDLLNEASEK